MKPVEEMLESEVLTELPDSVGARRTSLCDEAALNFLKRRLRNHAIQQADDRLTAAVRKNSAGDIVRALRDGR
jgi:hypothetical protein